ncbi:fumarylacetoacetate hydrolase family protein [Pseudaquidulcibacter saccharophilus]|uniref:fumarylacetoacetate hydrolase family protein n=1 Tax=Pseudaquidulcibacter saccharophilus TaxID=2831900 RepID=UPI001EFF4277|nr:fumarylacetoacetate hydrolase family protein [Pseudaquidulcibacter saccharophilus]
MAKISVFEFENKKYVGVIDGDNVKITSEYIDFSSIEYAAKAKEFTKTLAIADVKILAPIPNPPRVFGMGKNYAEHAKEMASDVPTTQIWFAKQPTSINSPYGNVNKPVVSDMLDYEVELVVIIGKTCKHVPKERAQEVVFGYMVGCDFSVRDWQKASQTWNMGKGFDTHAPIGPYVLTPDEVNDLDALGLRCFVNGQKMQDGKIKDMVFKIPDMIEHLTKAMTLLPGDLLFTGTPSGVGMGRNPPFYLKAGDVVRCEIDEMGFIENEIVPEVVETVIK